MTSPTLYQFLVDTLAEWLPNESTRRHWLQASELGILEPDLVVDGVAATEFAAALLHRAA